MMLTSVTMVGWADVTDSDWGDFRRRRAVDVSSFVYIFKFGAQKQECHHVDKIIVTGFTRFSQNDNLPCSQ